MACFSLLRQLYQSSLARWLCPSGVRVARLARSSALLSLVALSIIRIDVYASTPSNARRATSSDADKSTLLEDLAFMAGYDMEDVLNGDVDFSDFTADDLLELLLALLLALVWRPPRMPRTVTSRKIYMRLKALEAYAGDGNPAPLAVSDQDGIVNALRYSVRFNGTAYTLLLPASYVNQVYIDENGYLWNMGTSAISGRLFVGTFDPTANTGDMLYLNPCLGNNFSANYHYGSPNYRRHYYWSSGSLRSTDTYGVVAVIEEPGYPFIQGETLSYIAIILLGVCCYVCGKKSVR